MSSNSSRSLFINEKVEKYHIPICRIYDIIHVETKGIISKNALLQMAFKAINNTIGPDSLILTLLIFGVNSQIITILPPSPLEQ